LFLLLFFVFVLFFFVFFFFEQSKLNAMYQWRIANDFEMFMDDLLT